MPDIYTDHYINTELVRLHSLIRGESRPPWAWSTNSPTLGIPTQPKTVIEKINQLWTRSSYFKSLPKQFSAKVVLETKKKPHIYYKDPRATW